MKRTLLLCVVLASASAFGQKAPATSKSAAKANCKGGSCRACKTCKYCADYKGGGTCSVCLKMEAALKAKEKIRKVARR